MRAVLGGRRVVFEERAVAYDRASPDAAAESRRKTRTLAGNYQILAQEPRLLLPIRESGLAAVPVAQDRPPARAVGAARAASSRAWRWRRTPASMRRRSARRCSSTAWRSRARLRSARALRAHRVHVRDDELLGGRRSRGAAARTRGLAVNERLASTRRRHRRGPRGTPARRPPRRSPAPTSTTAGARDQRAPEPRDWAFTWTLIFTAVLFLRPQDIFRRSMSLHLAEVSARSLGLGSLVHRPPRAAASAHAHHAGTGRACSPWRGHPADRAVLDLVRRRDRASSAISTSRSSWSTSWRSTC